jgi:hypothetical protein
MVVDANGNPYKSALGFVPLTISPHSNAPLFSQDKNPQLILQQLMSEMSSPSFSTTENARQIIRQAGYVSLWFYLKFICGYSGPYDQLDTELHVDMANFRQRVATEPGIKAACFVPRASYKTTVMSHGANGWELLRNPDLRIGCTSGVYDRALSFVKTTISTFRDNELHRWLYPEYTKVNRDDLDLMLGNRTRRYVEPSLKAITAGGSTQGMHFDIFDADDIVGEDLLNSDYSSTADMIRLGNWLHSNIRSLVVSWAKSKILVVGTRYSIDDPYETIMNHSREQVGYWDNVNYDLDPEGDWVTYYRPALQEDVSICPQAYDEKTLKFMSETNVWVFQTQYMNNPQAARPGDFNSYQVGKTRLCFDDDEHSGYYIDFLDGTTRDLNLADIVCASDPAASGHRVSARTSKSSSVVIARFSDDRVVILEINRGYVEATKFFDWLFEFKKKYKSLLRCSYVEAQAGFKAFIPIGRREQELRGEYINLLPVPALGEKETTIRNIIQPYLNRSKLYCDERVYSYLMEELKIFPSRSMDILDALKIAIYKSYRPESDDDDVDTDDNDERFSRTKRDTSRDKVSSISGY